MPLAIRLPAVAAACRALRRASSYGGKSIIRSRRNGRSWGGRSEARHNLRRSLIRLKRW